MIKIKINKFFPSISSVERFYYGGFKLWSTRCSSERDPIKYPVAPILTKKLFKSSRTNFSWLFLKWSILFCHWGLVLVFFLQNDHFKVLFYMLTYFGNRSEFEFIKNKLNIDVSQPKQNQRFDARRRCCRQNFPLKDVRRGNVPRVSYGNNRSRLRVKSLHSKGLRYRDPRQDLGHCGIGALWINDSLVLQAVSRHGGNLRCHQWSDVQECAQVDGVDLWTRRLEHLNHNGGQQNWSWGRAKN